MISDDEHKRIFGDPERSETPGRSRKCKVCGGWHRLDEPWPHNCRTEQRPMQILSAPQLAPDFPAHMTGQTDGAEYIPDRKAQREYMERNGLTNWEEGVGRGPDWVREREELDAITDTIKKYREIDSENLDPALKATERVGETDLGTDGAEVVPEGSPLIDMASPTETTL
ncbi:MAG: hypothetical protein AAF674_16945 [Pseudomonadota bacterium]